ncbi:YdaU family protein [Acidithiobacillus ferrivorans]
MQLASPEEFKAAFMLWTKSIHQVPAGSLPNDEAILAKLAGGYDDFRKPWQRIREMALYGWELCSDGKLYHHAVAGTVLDILSSVQVRTSSLVPQNAQVSAKAANKARQQRFRDNQRAKRAKENFQAPAPQGDGPLPTDETTTTTVTPPVTVLRITPVTLPIKEEDKEKDEDNVTVTSRVTPVTPLCVTPESPSPDDQDPCPSTREGTLCKKLRALGVRAAPHMVVVHEMCARHSDEHILAAAEIALEKKGSGIHVGYIAAMLKDPGRSSVKGAKNKQTDGPPNRSLLPPVVVTKSHFIAL